MQTIKCVKLDQNIIEQNNTEQSRKKNTTQWNGIGYYTKFQILVSDKSLVTAMKIKVIHIHNFESYENGYWRMMEKMGYKNEILYKVNEARNILHTIKRRKAKHVRFLLGFLTLEGGTDRLSQNVRKELQLHAA